MDCTFSGSDSKGTLHLVPKIPVRINYPCCKPTVNWWHYIAIADSEAKAKILAEGRYGQASIVGTPEQVAEQLWPFIELGIEHLLFEFVDFPSTAGSRLFENEVIPKLLPQEQA